jgi:RNA polymerase sigma-70 factor (ECF subfamily)
MSYPFQALDVAPNARTAREQLSLEELYRLYREPVRRYLCQLCGADDQAEELTQETFIKAYTGLLAFRGECSVATWLFRIARNLYLNSLRRPDPARIDAAGEQRDLIGRALGQLPEQQRSVLLLRDAEGLAYIEIADVLGISLAAVKVNLFRARNAFRQAYRALDDQGDDHDRL